MALRTVTRPDPSFAPETMQGPQTRHGRKSKPQVLQIGTYWYRPGLRNRAAQDMENISEPSFVVARRSAPWLRRAPLRWEKVEAELETCLRVPSCGRVLFELMSESG